MEYRIDYDRIDVADIMDQVKKKAAERPSVPETPAPGTDTPPPAGPAPRPAVPPPAPPSRGWKGRLKRLVRFLLRPYLPILIAADEWYRFRTNLPVLIRIDETATDLMKTRDKLQEGLSETRGELAARIGTTQETAKLLHNLSHNLVVELTKLKVEEEALKSKVRVLEKEFETLGRREKAIEKKVFE
jgi:hypothetical protein